MNPAGKSAALLAVIAATLTVSCSQAGSPMKEAASASPIAASASTSTKNATASAVTVPVSNGGTASSVEASAQTGSLGVRVGLGAYYDDPMAGITVRVQRITGCGDENFRAPDVFSDGLSAVTGTDGTVHFGGLALGCYYVAADIPDGYVSIGSLDYGLSLTESEPNLEVGLTLAEDKSACEEEAFDALGLFPRGSNILYCEGDWAVVDANSPGDTARLMQWQGTHWVSYAAFPTNECRSKAVQDGVPETYVGSFNQAC